MEKPTTKSKSLFSKFLPRVVTFKGPPFSPAPCRGFSGQISIIPAEARRRSNSHEIESQEPTSPKVSCIGQIKQRNKNKKKKTTNKSNKKLVNQSMNQEKMAPHRSSGYTPARKSESSADKKRDEIPSISKMKKFASSRDALSGFDWTAYLAVEEDEEEEECRVSYSAPIERETERKEVNLWRRRSVSPLPPLKVHASSSSSTR